MDVIVHGVRVVGAKVDAETRCAHYHGDRDIIAIKFKCCGDWYPCHQCHAEFAGHAAAVWPQEEFNVRAILCGGCGHQLSVRQYLECDSICPSCRREFNPNCAQHYPLYFAS